jgi:hypothetical protein
LVWLTICMQMDGPQQEQTPFDTFLSVQIIVRMGIEVTSKISAASLPRMVRLQVYYVAKQCSQKCTAEEYAIALGKHFVSTYPEVGSPGQAPSLERSDGTRQCLIHQLDACEVQVTKAKIWVEQKPWQRVSIGGKAHDHGASAIPAAKSSSVHDAAAPHKHCTENACKAWSCTIVTSACLLQATRWQAQRRGQRM